MLNAWEVEKDRLFANNEIHDIAVAIGVDPHAATDTPDLSGLRYGKICILSDADVDGSHIQVLLLTLFFRHFPKLIENGNIHIAKPPLYRVDAPARGKKPAAKIYALDEGELTATLARCAKGRRREGSWATALQSGRDERGAAVGQHAEYRDTGPAAGGVRKLASPARPSSLDPVRGQGLGAGAARAEGAAGDAVEVEV